MQKPLVFLHIAKTAGTSLLREIAKHVSKNAMMTHGDFLHLPPGPLPARTVAAHDVIAGHFGYDQVAHLMTNSNSFTFLRDPIARVLSFYQFCQHPDMQRRFPAARAAKNLGADAFFCSTLPEVGEALDNQQCWQLASSYWYRDRQRHRDWSEELLLATARENLKHFSVVGLTETFADDFGRVLRLCDIAHPATIPHEFRSPEVFSFNSLLPATQETLRDRLALDSELYRGCLAARS